MADYDYTKITYESLLIAVVSTFGNGEPPDNGKLFVKMAEAYRMHMTKGAEGTTVQGIMRQNSLNHDRPMLVHLLITLFTAALLCIFCDRSCVFMPPYTRNPPASTNHRAAFDCLRLN